MKKIILVHRWSGGPLDDWRPWLKSELEKQGHRVLVPEMPDHDVPVIEKWVSKLEEVVGIPDKNTYFIGHSIGCQAILRYLEKITTPIGGAVFVAGWFNLSNLESEEVSDISRPWTETPIDLEKVKAILPKSALIISDNDPYNCFEENKEKFIELGSEIVIVPNAGHFTQEDGYMELPIALETFNKIFKI